MLLQSFTGRAGAILCLLVSVTYAIYDPTGEGDFSPVLRSTSMVATMVNTADITVAEPEAEAEATTGAEGVSDRSRLGPWNAVLCEEKRLHMECPAGYQLRIQTELSFFGRQDGASTCAEEPISVESCQQEAPIETIMSLCENINHCTFQVNQEVFGRPCEVPTGIEPSTFKYYLNITFACELEIETQTVCEHENQVEYLGISCFAGMALNIERVFYGREDTETCVVDGMDSTTSCSHENAFELVSTQCNGREWCYINATADYFDDNCPQVSKYLQVDYTCGECDNDWGTDSDCATWALGGDCEANADWMYGYCRETCTGCHTAHSCLNIAAYDECYFWSFNGECQNNPEWMSLYCREACNLCTQDYQVPEPEEPQPMWSAPEPTDDLEIEVTTACPDEEAQLTCPDGQHIKIFDVYYGRQNGWICMNETVSDTLACGNTSPGPFETTTYACNGRQSCGVLNPAVAEGVVHPFEDPCPGTDTNRYLEVKWSCVACDNPWAEEPEIESGNEDCDYWQSWSECDYNRNWMTDNCYSSCSGCSLAEECDNQEEDWLCDYWSMTGECENNPRWMQYNCAKSCRTCYAIEECRNVVSDETCDYWADIGECTVNSWMESNCARSCNTCWAMEGQTDVFFDGNTYGKK